MCNCSLRTKLVGDGCAECNPDYAIDDGVWCDVFGGPCEDCGACYLEEEEDADL